MVKKMLKLSICIPTHNRANFLPTAIDSVIYQVTEKNKERLELCISDNASTDSTQEVVEKITSKSPIPITYHRNEKNEGADYNFIKVIEIAKGDFCWFLGSDDKIENGAIDEIFNVIDKNPQLTTITVFRNDYNIDMTKRNPTISSFSRINKDFVANSYDEIKKYIDLMFPYFGYISAQIVNKSLWDETLYGIDDINKYFKAYVHTYIITKMIQKYHKAMFIRKPLVGNRMGNDSFLEDNHEGIIKRCLLDINGYRQIIDELLKNWDNKVYKNVTCHIATIYMKQHMINVKKTRLPVSRKFWIWKKVIKTYWWIPFFWIKTFPYIIIPRPIFMVCRKFWITYLKPKPLVVSKI
jgi:abequosyltransferase